MRLWGSRYVWQLGQGGGGVERGGAGAGSGLIVQSSGGQLAAAASSHLIDLALARAVGHLTYILSAGIHDLATRG